MHVYELRHDCSSPQIGFNRMSTAHAELRKPGYPPLYLPQHPDEHRPERAVLLAVDREPTEWDYVSPP